MSVKGYLYSEEETTTESEDEITGGTTTPTMDSTTGTITTKWERGEQECVVVSDVRLSSNSLLGSSDGTNGQARQLRKGTLYLTTWRLCWEEEEEEGGEGHRRVKVCVALPKLASMVKEGRLKQTSSDYVLRFQTKDFRRFALSFDACRPELRKIRAYLTERGGSQCPTSDLFAYCREPVFAFDEDALYREGYVRMGCEGTTSGWRCSNANDKYGICDSYPRQLWVCAALTDQDYEQIAQYRSRGRFPVLSWTRGGGFAGCIIRCAQPRMGFARKTSRDDERLFAYLATEANPSAERLTIFDSRPKVNAVANQARGGGFENMAHYPKCQLVFQDIANIHVMRAALNGLDDALHGEDSKWFSAFEEWISHISSLMQAASDVRDEVHSGRIVCVHCSDGWDRTAQICSLTQLMLDPYARTVRGFLSLLHREWVSLGHKFKTRLNVGLNEPEESAPIFLQFLDATYQIMVQFPTAFEFTDALLVATMSAALSGRFGTFLHDCEKERREAASNVVAPPSFYAYILGGAGTFLNAAYERTAFEQNPVIPSPQYKQLSLWRRMYIASANATE